MALAGCDASLPVVETSRFACVDDEPFDDNILPCGPEGWCVEGGCAPRLGCTEAGRSEGCTPPSAGGSGTSPTRCEPVFGSGFTAVRCEPGLWTPTQTSTRPADFAACSCPDGLHCVAFVGDGVSADGYAPDLRVLLGGGPALPGEVPERRTCVRACSVEDNCPAQHSCRPAAVERMPASEDRRRDTIAVCYPDLIAETSSTSSVAQPISDACRSTAECDRGQACQYRVDDVLDHPEEPIGSQTWGVRKALVPHCVERLDSQQREANRPCTSGTDCLSGVCGATARCRAPCDPENPAVPCERRSCVEETVERTTGTEVIVDRVFVCEL
ncbi:MAG: hypothetical protein AAFU79_09820 [Myxococcota bacterium]